MAKDYYKILGVDKNASADDIKKAYKTLAKKYHPDVNKEPNATEKFKEVNEAASVLGDPKKRQQYDRFGSADQAGAGFNYQDMSGMDFGDIFDNLFSGFGFGGRQRGPSRGSDLQYELELDLHEAAAGKQEHVSFKTHASCTACNGSGSTSGDIESCTTCSGRGRVNRTQRTPFGVIQTQVTCPTCRGEGQTLKDPCTTCDGTGRELRTVRVEVNIPPGVDNGT